MQKIQARLSQQQATVILALKTEKEMYSEKYAHRKQKPIDKVLFLATTLQRL